MSAEARRMTFSQEMEALRRQKGRLEPTEIARLALKAELSAREALLEIGCPIDFASDEERVLEEERWLPLLDNLEPRTLERALACGR